ncbi:hypothetical protein OG912_32220 [Streptomyces sp. NBC_00464]|uniref:hypothetical protein n=1 Tax=Streptomyces sp. NBC_00464 TaxID=2975751 RepID=UPI002E16EF27
MSVLEDKLSDAHRHIVYDGDSDIPYDVYLVLEALAAEVQALREAATTRGPVESGGMSRVDALKAAREHVEAMSTNSRGYQDGVKLSDKVQAMDAFARFLMGESA